MARKRRFAQLELGLDDVRKAVVEEPWGGKSPRVLTRAFVAFSLVREGMGRLDQDASHVGDVRVREVQLDLPFLLS